MKKILTSAALLLAVTLSASALPFDKYSINRDDLPETAQEFLNTHFPKGKVSMVKTDKHLLKKTDYDVKLVNGTKIDFNNKGEWTIVDCKTKAVPVALLISPIKKYLKKHYSGQTVVKIEKKALAFELTLDDGTELKFDRLGTFKSAKAPAENAVSE